MGLHIRLTSIGGFCALWGPGAAPRFTCLVVQPQCLGQKRSGVQSVGTHWSVMLNVDLLELCIREITAVVGDSTNRAAANIHDLYLHRLKCTIGL